MPSLYVPGPTNWFINSGVSKAYEYLGMCEGQTRLSLNPIFDDIYVDGAGSRVPYDQEFQGCEATVSGDLIRYNEGVLGRVKRWLNDSNQVAGTFTEGSLGTLVRTEDKAFSLVIVSKYGTKVVFQNANMAAAWLFNLAIPVGGWDVGLGTKTKRERVIFRCLPVANLNGGGTLYSNDVSGLTLPNPT